jgi:hypothetical protein
MSWGASHVDEACSAAAILHHGCLAESEARHQRAAGPQQIGTSGGYPDVSRVVLHALRRGKTRTTGLSLRESLLNSAEPLLTALVRTAHQITEDADD